MVQAFLQNQLIQFKLGDALLQPRVLLPEAAQLRKLRPRHSAEEPEPVVAGRIAEAYRAERRLNISAV